MTKNVKKLTALTLFFYILDRKLQFNYPLRTHKHQRKPSVLKREHPALQNMKILILLSVFVVIFALLDPDPAT
jgi:hypothetical protein